MPNATTTSAGTACTDTGVAIYEYLGYTCVGDWCTIGEAVGACTTDCGGCAVHYPARCPNHQTGRCEQCPDAPTLLPTPAPTEDRWPTLNPTGTCPSDCSGANCDYWLEVGGYSCLYLESNQGCSCDGCDCGETEPPTLAPTIGTDTEAPSILPVPQPTPKPTLTMMPTTPAPTSSPTAVPVPEPTSAPSGAPTRFKDRGDYDDWLRGQAAVDDVAAQEGQSRT